MVKVATPSGHDGRNFKRDWSQVKSPKMEKFLRDLISFMRDVGDPTHKELVELYGNAGYSTDGTFQCVLSNAQYLRRQCWPLIEEEIHCRVRGYAHQALKQIVTLMNDEGTKPELKFKCAQDIMNRAGVEAPKRIDIKTEDITQKSNEELTGKLKNLLEEMGVTTTKEVQGEVIEQEDTEDGHTTER